jgi:hypothetical protein
MTGPALKVFTGALPEIANAAAAVSADFFKKALRVIVVIGTSRDKLND